MTYAEVGARAVGKVAHALKTGRLAKPDRCEDCAATEKLQGHHHRGYAPEHALDVVWLCRPCHMTRHGRRVLPSWERRARAYLAATGRTIDYRNPPKSRSFTDASSPKRLLKVLTFLWLALRTDEERDAARALIDELDAQRKENVA